MIQYGAIAPARPDHGALLKYEAACQALAEAKSVDEVMGVRDEGERIRFYAKQAKNKQLEIDAAEIRIRAERRIGEMMAAQRDAGLLNGGSKGLGSNQHQVRVASEPAPPTLSEAGIDKNLANRARKLAAVPEKEFENTITDWRERIEIENERVSIDLLNLGKKASRKADIEQQRREIATSIALPDGEYDVVVMDPPWNYGREYDPEGSRVANPYPEMTQSELLEMRPPFSSDCVLFLWTTHQFIWDAKGLMDEWGFQYKATLVWDKEKIGMGHWLRMQCEFCLVGIKGKPFWSNTTWRDIIRESRREHSRKPDTFYEMVEAVTAGSRRLDYFSREQREGWTSFGNDKERF